MLATAEPVRLIVWDLDETFWKGTLTEGGIREYVRTHHDIVIELARRGIISSICSKNEPEQVLAILKENEILDYFVFPSISWQPKGVRVASIIEALQLRPTTVMFIDDNPNNLAEVKSFNPGIQVANETFIERILIDERFRGKNDAALTRLKQYKVLELKHENRAVAPNTLQFLRDSKIIVSIEHDVIAHLDRAVELINRTNQLNYTKLRLSDNLNLAREELSELISKHWVVSGLVHVQDQFGDYGLCGFYALSKAPDSTHLVHFCFSCRAMHMGVEAYIYQYLGEPALHVKGAVTYDVKRQPRVDWISNYFGAHTTTGEIEQRISSLHLSGGCDILAIEHYLAPKADRMIRRVDTVYRGLTVRKDHSAFLAEIAMPPTEFQNETLTALGYPDDILDPSFFNGDQHSVWLFSFWSDAHVRTYRTSEDSQYIPVHIPELIGADLTRLDALPPPEWQGIVDFLCSQFEDAGLIDEQLFRLRMRVILARIPDGARIFFLTLDARDPKQSRVDSWARSIAASRSSVKVIDLDEFVTVAEKSRSLHHYDRMVYFQAAKAILSEIGCRI